VSGFAVAKLDEIPKRDTWIPVRDHLKIGAFGVNAYHAEEAGGRLISEHSELMAKHEELYVVVEGHATFTVDGQEVDAPTGTLVFVREPGTRRSAVAKQAGTTVLVTGARPGHAFEVAPWEDSWEENQEAMKLYRDERYEEAGDVLREAIKHHPDSAGLFYNLACFDSKAGADGPSVAEHLGRAIALYPGFRDFAREDSDLEQVRSDPAIEALVGELSDGVFSS
jgi:mannose-6-phosphate isomerase-like protein (cupin superfamily)